MTEKGFHQPRLWKDWEPSPEILAEAIDLMKKHPLCLWDKLKDAERQEKALKDIPLDEMNVITTNILSKHFSDADVMMNIDLYLSLRKAAREECGIIDED